MSHSGYVVYSFTVQPSDPARGGSKLRAISQCNACLTGVMFVRNIWHHYQLFFQNLCLHVNVWENISCSMCLTDQMYFKCMLWAWKRMPSINLSVAQKAFPLSGNEIVCWPQMDRNTIRLTGLLFTHLTCLTKKYKRGLFLICHNWAVAPSGTTKHHNKGPEGQGNGLKQIPFN